MKILTGLIITLLFISSAEALHNREGRNRNNINSPSHDRASFRRSGRNHRHHGFTSIKGCVDQAFSFSGLNMGSFDEARNFCKGLYFEFYSTKDCVDQAFDSSGLNMATYDEARNYCKGQYFEFYSMKDCVDQAFDSSGLNMATYDAAREYCKKALFN